MVPIAAVQFHTVTQIFHQGASGKVEGYSEKLLSSYLPAERATLRCLGSGGPI